MHRSRPQPPKHHSRSHGYPSKQHADTNQWSNRASYAPGYSIYSYRPSSPAPARRYSSSPEPYTYAYDYPDRYSTSPMPRLHRKVSLPRKQVHFDLAPHSTPQKHVPRWPSRPTIPQHDLPHTTLRPAVPPEPRRYKYKADTHYEVPPSAYAYQRAPSQPNLRRQAPHRNLRQASAAPPPSTAHPTIHIITYAHTLVRSEAAVHRLLAANLPSGTAHLYTIGAYNFTPPPAHLCKAYSGVAPIIQDCVMRDARAQRAVSDAIDDILAYRRRERLREREGRGPARRDVAISVCCMFGTHRSVSVAEKIAEELVGLGLGGVRVKVRHVHRVRGYRDPY